MKKALLILPVALYLSMAACSNQSTNVHIGGGVSSFVKDSAAFNREFNNDLLICNFSFNGVNNSGDKLDTALITDARTTEFSKLMAHTSKEEITVAVLTRPENADSVKLKGVSDKLVAYLKKDVLFGGFKKYTVNIAADGSPLSVYTY